MKIKKIVPIILIIIIIASLIISYMYFFQDKEIEPFYLEDKYYEENKIEEKDYNSIKELIKKKENFVVFIYQPSCIVSADFESILQGFLKENQLKILKLAFSEIKDTSIGKTIDFYPSFLIFRKGKIIDYLDVNSDEDVKSFTEKDEFKNWLTNYVILKDIEVTNDDDNNEINEEDLNIDNIDLSHIAKENGKINIYLFWGNGCPHCENEKNFLKTLQEQYGNLYNLYSFETWYNEDNQKLQKVFAKEMNEEARGVPYTIIGNKSFKGFGEEYKNDMISAITDEKNRKFDVYFDKVKKDK